MCRTEGGGDEEQKKWNGRGRAGEKGNWREEKRKEREMERKAVSRERD